ncbi:MAG: transcriptional regulator [Gammaproteobacteria bacterium SG8_31]|jgi:DNA-binding transcriptional LysR family regulator|nr:MAG: transcriptional regulator [Gammaproteobacteria bacterium SG8_31]
MHLTLRQLEIFAQAARHSSLTRAAEHLHLSQPAVSMQIKQLEDAVGMPLFDRVGKGLRLTEAGRELERYSREINAKVDEIGQVMDEIRGLKRGALNIAVATTVSQYAIQAVAGFHKLYPGIRVSLDVTNRKSLLNQLEAHEADIVLMGFPPKKRQLEAVPFMDNPLVVIAAPDHRLAGRKTIKLTEIAGETFLLREPGSGTRQAIERYLRDKGVTLSTTLFMSGNEAIKHAVEAGLGLAIVSRHTIALELKTGRLCELPVRGFPLVRQWFIVRPTTRRYSAAARAFSDFIVSGKVKF